MSTTNKQQYFFEGGGKMGQRMRETDWTQTPLGNPDNWPQSLQTMVSVILNNPLGMYIAWGKELTPIYNDGFLAIVRKINKRTDRRPSLCETLSQEWPAIETKLKEIMSGKIIACSDLVMPIKIDAENKNGYFDFNFSPIKLMQAKVGGVLLTVIERTTKKTIQKKLIDSEERFDTIVNTIPIAIAIMRGPNYVIEIANKNILEFWDRKEDEVLNKNLFEAIPELKTQGIQEHLDRVCSTGKRFSVTELPLKVMRLGSIEVVYVNFSYEPLFDQAGNSNGVMAIGFDVTNQVVSRHEIEKSEQRIRSLVESAPFPIGVYTGKEMRIALANESIIAAWGKQTDVIGKLYSEILPELENQNIYKQIGDVYESGIAFHAKNQRVDLVKKGVLKSFYYNYSFTPLLDFNGKIYGVMNTAAEVTELHEAKEKIEESEKRFRDAVQQAPVAMVIFRGKNNTVEMVNAPYLEIVGKTESEFLGKPLFESLPEVEEAVGSIINEIYKTKKAFYGYEFPVTLFRYGKKEKNYFNFVYHPLKEGNKVTGIMVVATQVTANVIAKKALEENEQKFRLLADSMPQFVWTANPEGKLNYFNQSVFDFSGISKAEIEQSGWLEIVHIEEREENTRRWMESILTEKDFLIEHRFRKSDGTYRWQLSRAIPQRDKEGKITMWVGTSTDIQDQKMFTNQLEKQVFERIKELNQKNEDLENMNKELQSFAYISSHDLQEPLRKIQTFATQINDREVKNLSDSGKDKFKRMQHAANRMQTLIQDLLAYSRTSIQEQIFEKTTLSAIIDEVKQDLEDDSLHNNATITIIDDCAIDIIPFQFRQLVFNLISNSLKFTKTNTVPKITIKCAIGTGATLGNEKLIGTKEYCHIKIEDNGIGFEEKYSEKIFEVFQRLHGKEKFDGTGIGLAIVKKIVDNHNGFITAKGVLNQGATFDIYLPVSFVEKAV